MNPPRPHNPRRLSALLRALRLRASVVNSRDCRAIRALAFFCFVVAAAAQSSAPHIGYIYPAGARTGTTTRVILGGQFLDGVTNARVSGAGVHARVIEHVKPVTQKQLTDFRDRLKELQKMRKDAAVLKEMADIRNRVMTFGRSMTPAIAERVTVEVALDAAAPAGDREIRLVTPNGLSNPLLFSVDELPEFTKRDTGDNDSQPFKSVRNPDQQTAVRATEATIHLPATINGQILRGGVDRYRFSARKGQHIVAAVRARELIPYLPDAVPGWFQATLALYDWRGRELAYDDDFRFHPDPVLHCEIPADGEYVAEIKDALYRGRDDFVYRISIGELPFITSIFPLGGRAGEDTVVELKGWNLPQTNLTVHAAGDRGTEHLSVRTGAYVSNLVPFASDDLPDLMEAEPNNSPAAAQQIALPSVINGRISAPGDSDVFRFDGQAGQVVVAEVYARRLDSPLDSVLKLTDASGRQLAFNDDHEDKGSGLNTHHADSLITATLPASGTFYVQLADA